MYRSPHQDAMDDVREDTCVQPERTVRIPGCYVYSKIILELLLLVVLEVRIRYWFWEEQMI